MKVKTIIFLLLGIPAFHSCLGQKLTQSIENALGEKLYARFSGSTYVKETGENSFLFLVNTNNSQDCYDKAIVIFSEKSLEKPDFKENETFEFFIPESRRFAVIYNYKEEEIFVAGLDDQSVRQFIQKFKSIENKETALNNNHVLGYGMSFLSNSLWNISRIKESKYKSPFYSLDYADMINTDARESLPPPGDDDGGGVSCAPGVCTSGGAGSSECSITEAPFGQECSVTCITGYYACCVSSTVRCYCCKI